jgi:hypothetical protein
MCLVNGIPKPHHLEPWLLESTEPGKREAQTAGK